MSLNLANPIDGFLVSDTIITIDGLLPMYSMGTIINNKLVAARAGVVTPDGGLNYAELAFYSYSDVQLYAIQNPIQCTDTGYYTFGGNVVPFAPSNLRASILSQQEYESFIDGWNNLKLIKENLRSGVTFSEDAEHGCKTSEIYLQQGQYITFWQIVEPQQLLDGFTINLRTIAHESTDTEPEIECGVFKFFRASSDFENLVSQEYPGMSLTMNFKVQLDSPAEKKYSFIPYAAAAYSTGGFEEDKIGGLDISQIDDSFLGGEQRLNASLGFNVKNGEYSNFSNITYIESTFKENEYWLRLCLKERLDLSYEQSYFLKIIVKHKQSGTIIQQVTRYIDEPTYSIEKVDSKETAESPESVRGSWTLSFAGEETNDGQQPFFSQKINFYSTAKTIRCRESDSDTALKNFETNFLSTWMEIQTPTSKLSDGEYTIELALVPGQNCSFAEFYAYAKTLPAGASHTTIVSGSMGEIKSGATSSEICSVGFSSFYVASTIDGVSTQPSVNTNGQMRKSPVFIKFKNIYTDEEANELMQKAKIVITGFKGTLVQKSCLCKGTKISMADGTLKNIEDIQVNDLVMSDQGPTIVYRIEDAVTPGYHTLHYFEDGTIIDEGYDHNFFNVEQGFSAPLKSWVIGEHALNLFKEQVALIKSEDVGGAVPCYGIWTESGTYYANGLLSADSRKNITLMEEFSLEDGVRLLERLCSQDVISTLSF